MSGRRFKFDIRQAGKPLVTVLVCWLVLCVGFYAFLVRPKVSQYRSLATRSGPQFQELKQRRDMVEARESFLKALETAEADMVRLREEVLATREQRVVEVHAEVHRLCEQFNIDLESVSYSNDLLMEEELDKEVMTVPLQGGYANLRRFIQAVESSDKFLIVERVALDENKEGGVLLQLSITLATYFDLPEELKHLKPPARRRPTRQRDA